jgi:polyisoprenoid-binding protein YceI
MTVTNTTVEIPGYIAGTWAIDPVHSEVSFSVRHMMVSKVRGLFRDFSGTLVLADDPLASSVTAEIDVDSIDTRNDQRDAHIRSADFFDAEQFPTMTFRSTAVRPARNGLVVEGELSLHGVTRTVELDLDVNGFTPDPYGGTRVGFTATGHINRRDFGIDIDMPMDGGGVVVGDKVTITLEVQAVLQQS